MTIINLVGKEILTSLGISNICRSRILLFVSALIFSNFTLFSQKMYRVTKPMVVSSCDGICRLACCEYSARSVFTLEPSHRFFESDPECPVLIASYVELKFVKKKCIALKPYQLSEDPVREISWITSIIESFNYYLSDKPLGVGNLGLVTGICFGYYDKRTVSEKKHGKVFVGVVTGYDVINLQWSSSVVASFPLFKLSNRLWIHANAGFDIARELAYKQNGGHIGASCRFLCF